jgi:hypothetical protein
MRYIDPQAKQVTCVLEFMKSEQERTTYSASQQRLPEGGLYPFSIFN